MNDKEFEQKLLEDFIDSLTEYVIIFIGFTILTLPAMLII